MVNDYILRKLTYGTADFFQTNESHDGSPENRVKGYSLGVGSKCNKAKVYTPLGGSLRDDV